MSKRNQKGIGKIKLTKNQEPIVTPVDNQRLDLRIWINPGNYMGPTKRAVRFYLFDGIWEQLKRLVDKVDKVYEGIA